MENDNPRPRIQWHLLNKRPTFLGVAHITILIPLICYPFLKYGGIFIILWLAVDFLLVYTQFRLAAFITRIRLWAGGPKRTSISKRAYQNTKQGN